MGKISTKTAESPKTAKMTSVPTPAEMKAYLDKYVIGQDEAKKTLCVAVYNHYKRIALRDAGLLDDEDMQKSNVILLGETGSGKTLLVKTIAKMIGVGCHIQDCSKLTASGYVGSDVEECIVGLLRNTSFNMAKTERGIVMLDEIDKNAAKTAGLSITRDVSGECVQQSLLKIVEGDVVGCPPQGGRKHPEIPLIYVNTKDILFIASGAFVGLDTIVSKRLGGDNNRIGFATGTASGQETGGSVLSHVIPQDLRDFGMIPEFVGRFPVIANVEPLSTGDLKRILTEPKDSLVGQYKRLLALDKVDLEFTPDALETIASVANEMGTGARGLRNIVETVMRDIMFEAPSMTKGSRKEKKIVVDAALVNEKLSLTRGVKITA